MGAPEVTWSPSHTSWHLTRCSITWNWFKRIYLTFTKGNLQLEMTKEEFLYAAQQMSQLTPLEIEILFHLAGFLHQRTGRVSYIDLERIAPYRPTRYLSKPIAEVKAVESPSDRGVVIQILESAYRFTLGSVAGAAGATVVYPIDLVLSFTVFIITII